MKATVIKSGRLGAAASLIGFVALIPITIFVGVIAALDSPLMAVTVTAALLAWMIWIVYAGAVSSNVSITDGGTVNLGIYFLFKHLTWTGTRQDITAIMHITYDNGEGDEKTVIVEVNLIGPVRLQGWNLSKAKQLGQAIGMEVRDIKVDRVPQSLSRRELTRLLTQPT